MVAISALYAAAVAVFALLFRSGKPWARTALMSVSALALLTLFAPNALNLGVIVLLLATCVLVYRRPSERGFARFRGEPQPDRRGRYGDVVEESP